MRDYIDIGPSPSDEDCVQVGDDNYTRKATVECRRFIELIRKTLGEEPKNTQLRVKFEPHEFGSYASVVCYYDDNDKESIDYAFRCESEAPTRWED